MRTGAHTQARTHARPYEFTLPNFSDVSKKAILADPRRIQTRRSGVHGKGVFALRDLTEGEVIVEYVGAIISWKEAQRRHPHNPADPNHTFYFHIDEKRVIDALYGGYSSLRSGLTLRPPRLSCRPKSSSVPPSKSMRLAT